MAAWGIPNRPSGFCKETGIRLGQNRKIRIETHANGGNIDGLPLNWHASDAEDLLDSGRDLGSDTISRDQGDLWCSGRKGPGIDGGLGHLKEVTLVI